MTQNSWQDKFQSFEMAYNQLRHGLEIVPPPELKDMIGESLVQRFEYTFELAWKTMKSYLEHNGFFATPLNARAIIKEAYANNLVRDGQGWIDMLDARNTMSPTCSAQRFNQFTDALRDRYFSLIESFYLALKEELSR